jgi:hypothetical protein
MRTISSISTTLGITLRRYFFTGAAMLALNVSNYYTGVLYWYWQAWPPSANAPVGRYNATG